MPSAELKVSMGILQRKGQPSWVFAIKCSRIWLLHTRRCNKLNFGFDILPGNNVAILRNYDGQSGAFGADQIKLVAHQSRNDGPLAPTARSQPSTNATIGVHNLAIE